MISIALALVLSQAVVPGLRGRVCHDDLGEGNLCGWGYVRTPLVTAPTPAFFEFAPASGVGMGEACSCVDVTGTKGEALTFTRASTATCVKGSPTTGIANGDLVTCAVNQPRVGNPDGLGLALLVEKTAQNVALRSEEFDNATWGPLNGAGCAATTVTANAGTAPNGAATADRLQVPSCVGAGGYSIRRQAVTIAASSTCSLFVRSYTGAGAQTLYMSDGSESVACSSVEASWSRCKLAVPGARTFLDVGTNNNLTPPGAGGAAAADVLVWGAQCEAGTRATSYIPTTIAAVTRSADATPWFPWTQNLSAAGSTAVTLYDVSPTAAGDSAGLTFTTGTTVALGFLAPYLANDTTVGVYISGATNSVTVPSMPGRSTRIATSWTGTSFTTWANGTSQTNTAAAAPSGSIQRLWLGAYSTTNQVGGYIGNVCVDPSPTKCR